MEARITRAVLLAAALIVSMGASYRTPNFIVRTGDPQLAEQIGKAAEKYRRELAVSWLGNPMRNWSAPCVMTVRAGANLGAGGATTFIFDRGEVFGWRMTIQGSIERILDSVLPHEITHMIFASHFRCPLPRWADEGGATSVEHSSELAKHRVSLVRFLKTNRGISFSRMFAMREYPADIMPLYAQGYSLAEFLIQMKGRRAYVAFLADGLKDNRWSEAIRRHYGVTDLGSLQNTWLAWVRQGSPPLKSRDGQPETAAPPEVLAAVGKLPRPEPNLIYRGGGRAATSAADNLVPVRRRDSNAVISSGRITPKNALAATAGPPVKILPASGWHAAGHRPANPPTPVAVGSPATEPLHTQAAHPQPIERSRQVIMQWGQ